jgi:LPXTG-motif cell wall-anchored protein
MYGSRVRRRTQLPLLAVLAVLALGPASAALAQSAGDRQYTDPLAGGGQSQPQPRQDDTPVDSGTTDDAGTSAPAAPTPAPDSSSSAAAETTAAPQAALPRTGADTLLVAVLGLALTAGGWMALALPRRSRHARR